MSLSAEEKEQLEVIALHHNCTWGNKPNVSKLLSRIASGSLAIVGEKPVVEDAKSIKGKKAIQLIVRGLLELSCVLFQ